VPDFDVLEPAIDPNNRVSFLLDWELTMKCNLDCSYCGTGLYAGHDNSTKHPPLAECLDTVDFMYEYVDIYMRHKPKGLRYVILNVYGGEALHHPNIGEILRACHDRYQKYKDRWRLTITTTTNNIINESKFLTIISYIDEFTVSYHTENTDKQKELFKNNILAIKNAGKRVKCVVLMHPGADKFVDAQNMITWCQDNGVKYLPRQLDHFPAKIEFNYKKQQSTWLSDLYDEKSYKTSTDVFLKPAGEKFDLSDSGRSCCGGRQVCQDQNYKNRHFFVDNKFPDWYCSVNEFFLYIKQVNGEIFVNKDCKMDFSGKVAPIGNLKHADTLLDKTKNHLKNHTMPVIQCKKSSCWCGLCAPKAKNLGTFNSIMEKYRS
jgi:pyruvate-formate lyase-activating enzyme